VRLIRNRERIMSICLIWFPIGVLGDPNIYQNFGDFTRKWGGLLDGLKSNVRWWYSLQIYRLHLLY